MNKKVTVLFLGCILVIAAILRFYQLGSIPISPDWDEVSLGYNAYSISQTGKDEYGTFLPVVLRSFGDYKPALYTYLAIPFVQILGLTTTAVRLPSAIFGILTVLATYFLVKELFPLKQYKRGEVLALFSALFLALSPWHIQFSRVAFESNIGLSLNVFGLLFFLKGLKRSVFLLPSIIFFALSIYAYQSEKIFIPLVGVLLLYLYGKQLLKVSHKTLGFVILSGIIILLPMLLFVISNPNAFSRAAGVSIFNNPNATIERIAKRQVINKQEGNGIGEILSSQKLSYIPVIIGNYLSHFDPNWLFIVGDKTGRHQPPFMGHLYLFELPFLLIGIYMLLFITVDRKTKYIIFGWILITPIASSVTWDVPNAVRVLNFLPMVQILIALGAFQTALWVKESTGKQAVVVKGIGAVFVTLIVGNIIYYMLQYFVQYNYFSSQDWQYGYQQVVGQVNNIQGKYNHIIISDKQPLDQSYIFFLYYLKYPPLKYQQEQRSNHSFSKYEFKAFNYADSQKDTLYVGSVDEFPKDVMSVEIINYLNGKPAMVIAPGK